MLILLIFCICINSLNAIIFDCYSGKPATSEQIDIFIERNNTQFCLIDVKPCDPYEWKRVDGSCNNLRFPSRGTIRTPTTRVLPPDFSPNYEPRRAADGRPLPLPRYLRTRLLKEGKFTDMDITQLVSYYILFELNDINSLHDMVNYLLNTTNCCTPEGQSNYICTPNKIPVYDPVHRYSGVKCQNLTRPQSFQYFGCIDFGTTQFARIEYATPVFDISGVYNFQIGSIDHLRTFERGLMKTEIVNGKIFPPGNPDRDPKTNFCPANVLPKETFCNLYQTSDVLGPNLFLIVFFRQHNYIALRLAEMNPCWDDDRIFYTARDINIAISMQIYFYELLPVVLGKKNLIRDGVISSSGGFRDLYDENILPLISDEYVYIKRWFHTVQETDLKLYDSNGFFVKRYPIVNLTTRTGNFPLDHNMEHYFQGSFRQYGGGFDHTINNDMSERSLGTLQFASDVSMNDLAKGRYFGFPPYVSYLEYCTGKPYKSFDSLIDVISEERIYRLTEVYENVEDIELMAGTWSEDRMQGGRVPPTVYCLMVEQLKRTLASDRHWFERPNRPHAFTLEQLRAIRKVTIAGVMCANADGVTQIQPNAFYKISPENPLTDCSSTLIGNIDLLPWRDLDGTYCSN